jgi:hypothetical protein
LAALQVATKDAAVGDEMAASGYPGVVDAITDPNMEPSFKTGRVSARQNYNGQPFLQHDAAVLGGMSGGPVVNMRGEVIGVTSYGPAAPVGADPVGFDFAAGLATLTRVMDSHGIKRELSPADQAFRDGLTAYFDGRYHEAAEQFDATLAEVPNHAQAQKFKRLATGKFGDESTSMPTQLVLSGGVLLFTLCAFVVALVLVLRKRKRNKVVPPPVTPPPAQASHQPASGVNRASDWRTGSTSSANSTAPVAAAISRCPACKVEYSGVTHRCSDGAGGTTPGSGGQREWWRK